MKRHFFTFFLCFSLISCLSASALPVYAESSDSVGKIHFAEDYQEIYEILKEVSYDLPVDYIIEDSYVEEDIAAEFARDTGVSSEADYSETNIREAGVDEADIFKTDGNFLYIVKEQTIISIVDIRSAEMNPVSSIDLASDSVLQNIRIEEFFLNGDTLTVLATFTESGEWYGEYSTCAVVYDISSREQPLLLRIITQDGEYESSRMKDGMLYLFSTWYPDVEGTYEDSRLVPSVNDQEIPADHVCLPSYVNDAAYLIVSSMDTLSPEQDILDTKVIVSSPDSLYVSTNNIYTLNGNYRNDRENTEIVKFHYENGEISGIGTANIRGYVNDSFSIDEYDGYLRVLTTYASTDIVDILDSVFGDSVSYSSIKNSLVIFDENMNNAGGIGGLARDQEIKSARFMGDTAYFVTFEQTDPLYSVDLSTPTEPKILGALHIPGFSSYLHSFGENRLLGLGYNADDNTGWTTGLKLSIYDTADKKDVQESDRFILPGITYCEAFDNYKAIFADSKKMLTGFYCDQHYFLFHYDENTGFERVLLYDLYEDMLNDRDKTGRILYAQDTLYLSDGSYIVSFDMNSGFAKKEVLIL